ncbi:hypothetical protein CCH79_00003435 [Gambusia affinis]|uniref:Cytochrome c oxidase assembly protein COX11, mitochondrial n=1 Tax=Gambusia affinis TaxID=33528 RepID=A0A315VDJ6_GAMAF|nr:hypothetical protein CCH79_00003435 [Gambusia affinis]
MSHGLDSTGPHHGFDPECSVHCALFDMQLSPSGEMLLPLLLRPSLSPRLTGCVRALHGSSQRTLLSQGEHLLRRRPASRLPTRNQSRKSRGQEEEWRTRNKTVLTYIAAAGVGMIGLSYASVPMYRLYCQATGLGGAAVAGHDTDQVETMKPVKERIIKVTFNADTHASIQWNFRPQQTEIYVRLPACAVREDTIFSVLNLPLLSTQVVPGETALAFYRAKNPTDKPIIGISTYNVCFCFEEQRLNPHEEVDMPVFFYIDPEFDDDPRMARVDTITLSYTFFEAKEGQQLPLPGYSYN